ncbi:MAG: hypothetical protein ACPGJV_00550 [Bacteriovoracaceae bacterium]
MLTSCAGPMDPFGAKELGQVLKDNSKNQSKDLLNHFDFDDFTESPSLARTPASEGKKIHPDHNHQRISFYPEKQNWHDRFDFQIIIEDELGIPYDYEIQILYNGTPLSDSQLRNFKASYTNDRKKLTLTSSSFRLPVMKDHDIHVFYWRDLETPPMISSFD